MAENLKELERLLKLCRKHGVKDIVFGNVSLSLGDLPERTMLSADSDEIESADPLADFPEGDLSPEELTFFASGGLPKDNPYREQ